ncbi:hypothetical protein LCGC14_2089410, partial [marine sediment metagenome]
MGFNRFLYNQSLYNQAVAAASSVDSGSTRSPFGHIMVAVPGGDLVLIYQQGANGLAYRVSQNGGSVWGAENIISTRTGVYASAIINRLTLDIHVVYSAHGDPSSTADEGIYYRPLLWDSATSTWDVGGEQTLAGGGSLYDPATAGRRNASISIGDDNFPVVTYLRNEFGTVSWAVLVSQEANALTDFDVDLEIGVAADEDSRGALQQSDSRTLYFVSRTGSSYNIASAIVANPVAATGINLTVLDSWFGAEGSMVAVARNDDGDRLGIVYLGGDGAPRFRLYNLTTNAFVSDTKMDTVAADSVTITWDGAVFWMAWVDNDNVQVSNSDAPATVVQTFANPGPDEDWSWLNSPISCVDIPTIAFAWAATASSIYVGIFQADRAIAEAETGAGADAAQIEANQAETGAGVDAATAVEAINQQDYSINQQPQGVYNQKNLLFNTEEFNQQVEGTELGVTAGPLAADTGVGVDAIIKAQVEAETGVGVDAATISVSSADTGSGADNAPIPTELIGAADTGAGDGETAAVRVLVPDTGVGVLTEAMGTTQAETGAGVDVARILLGPEAETGSGADAAPHGPLVTDVGTGVDAVGSVDKQGNAETGVG